MKGYDYWIQAWPKICFSTFANDGRMFESIETRDAAGVYHYAVGREFDLDEALLNAKPDRRVPTICMFNGARHE